MIYLQKQVSDSATDVDSEPERVSSFDLSSFSGSDIDVQTERSFGQISSVDKTSGRNKYVYLENHFLTQLM